MTNSNKRKAERLGIPHGTAQGKLRKALLFSLVQKTKQDDCFRCGDKIETVDELSIEHKSDWLNSDNPVELFYDLDNIAYSHLKCNKPYQTIARQVVSEKRKVGDEGKNWCSKCKQFLDESNFYKDRTRWNGVSAVCIEHAKEAKKNSRQ